MPGQDRSFSKHTPSQRRSKKPPQPKRPVHGSAPAPREESVPAVGEGRFTLSPPLRNLAIAACLIALTLAAFEGVRSHPFSLYDDQICVAKNRHIQLGLTWDGVVWAFTTLHMSHWHPVTWLSHMLDVELFGLDAGMHHVTSLALHASSAVVLFLLFARVTGSPWRSGFVAALFAIHPLHVESVAWVTERRDVLSTLLGFLTLAAWLRYLDRPRAGRYLVALALFALGLMAKSMLVTLPFLLLLFDYWPLRRLRLPGSDEHLSQGASRPTSSDHRSAPLPLTPRLPLTRLVWEKAPFFGLTLASCILAFIAQRLGGSLAPLQDLTVGSRLSQAAVACATYLLKALWPVQLAVFYPIQPHDLWVSIGAFLLLAAITASAVLLAKRAPYLAFGWFWYLVTLVPVIGLVQVGSQAMADRYTYIPLIGVFVAISWGVAELSPRGWLRTPALATASALVLAVFCVLTRMEVHLWKSDVDLFGRALAVTNNNWVAHNLLGAALYEMGNRVDALPHFEESLRLQPGNLDAVKNLALVLDEDGKTADAIGLYSKAISLQPDDPALHFRIAKALSREGRRAEALAHYKDVVRLDPDFGQARNNLANALADLGRFDEAIEQYREALRLNPDNPKAHYNLGITFLDAGRPDDAAAELAEALRLDPGFPEAHNSLGLILLKKGMVTEAVAQFEEALRLKPDYPRARRNLESALAESGRSHGITPAR